MVLYDYATSVKGFVSITALLGKTNVLQIGMDENATAILHSKITIPEFLFDKAKAIKKQK